MRRAGATVTNLLGVMMDFMRRPGVTAATWDRIKAGYRLREEIGRAERKRPRKGEEANGP